TMLLDAVRGGVKFPDTAAAFQSPRAQPFARAQLSRCRFAILGWRGNWQMNAESRAWFASQFVCDTPSAGDLCLWERFGSSHRTSIAFGDGWDGAGGTAAAFWGAGGGALGRARRDRRRMRGGGGERAQRRTSRLSPAARGWSSRSRSRGQTCR